MQVQAQILDNEQYLSLQLSEQIGRSTRVLEIIFDVPMQSREKEEDDAEDIVPVTLADAISSCSSVELFPLGILILAFAMTAI